MGTPSSSRKRAKARRRLSSERMATRARTLRPVTSSIASAKKRFLVIAPSITDCVAPPALSASRTWPIWPSFTQVSASTRSARAGSVSFLCATATTRCPARRALSAKSSGKRPPPAMSPMVAMRLPGDAALRAPAEGHEMCDLRVRAELPLHLREGLGEDEVRAEQDLVGLLHAPGLLLRHAHPLHAHGVQPGELRAG